MIVVYFLEIKYNVMSITTAKYITPIYFQIKKNIKTQIELLSRVLLEYS